LISNLVSLPSDITSNIELTDYRSMWCRTHYDVTNENNQFWRSQHT